MEIPHEDQSSHYDHEKDKFAYLSMRDRIELGKRQVQQSQWGSKYALNGDDSYEHTVGECPTIPTVRDMYGYQSSYTSSWNNHPNLATQPQPQPSMSTSSLEQAILKISKVMEDFVGEQQKINSHLNEKIDNLESSINVRMEGVYNDLSLRIEKVQDSIEKLTNLDIARGKRKLPPQPHHNLQGTNAKRSRKVLMIDTLVGDCYDNSMDQSSIENHKVQDDKGLPEPFKASTSPGKRREMNSLGPNGKDANFVWDPGGIQHEVGVYDACKNRSYGENKRKQGRKAKTEQFTPPHFGNCWAHFDHLRSSFHAYYISFQILGSQESIGSNGARFGSHPILLLLDTFLEHFLELKLCIPYLFLKLRKSRVVYLLNSKSTSHEVPLPSSLFSIQTLRTMFISVGGRDEEVSISLNFYHTYMVRRVAKTFKAWCPKPLLVGSHRSSACYMGELVKFIYESVQACQMMEELLGQVKARILDVYKLEFQVETRAQAKRSKEQKQANSGSQESNASNRARFGAEMRKIWPSEANCSRLCENFAFHKV
ncbi:hypothetical protein AAG906_016239 [Vitis piasezkii]